MAFDPDRVETITVDSFGTLVDPSAAETALAEHVEEPAPISNLWRSRSLHYAMVGNFVDAYQPFYGMNRDALQFALESHDVHLEAETIDEILSVYHELEVFPDVRDGLERLTDAYDVYVLSNGDPALLESMVDRAEIGGLIADAISADEVRTFKPDVELYRHAAGRTGTPIDAIAHVAGPSFDVQGAMHAGMQGVWLDRGRGPWDPFGAAPDLTVETFHELADELDV